jgi:hypothetical protein
MGQYFELVNLDKRERISAFNFRQGVLCFDVFTSGMKMYEILNNLGKKPMLCSAILDQSVLINPLRLNPLFGSWAGDRILFIGDYSEDMPDFLTDAEKRELREKNIGLFGLAAEEFKEIEYRDFIKENENLCDALGGHGVHHVIVNIDDQEYLVADKVGEGSADLFMMDPDGIVRTFVGLLFHSNGSGGGDVELLKEGPWAGKRVAIWKADDERLDGFTDITETATSEVNNALGL